MLKRIVIGLLAVLGIGGGLYVSSVFSGPKKGTVEYHKRAYLKARDGSKIVRNMQADWYRISGHLSKSFGNQNPVDPTEMEAHERALMKLGYIEERRFETRIGAAATAERLYMAFAENSTRRGNVFVQRPIARITDWGTNFIVLRAAREDMPKWEAIVDRSNGRRPKVRN